MRSLVGLIFEDDDAQTDVSGGNDKGYASCTSYNVRTVSKQRNKEQAILTDADESKLPAISETDNGSSKQTSNTLHNAEGRMSALGHDEVKNEKKQLTLPV